MSECSGYVCGVQLNLWQTSQGGFKQGTETVWDGGVDSLGSDNRRYSCLLAQTRPPEQLQAAVVMTSKPTASQQQAAAGQLAAADVLQKLHVQISD
jgi:hypothetical protein